MKKIEVFHNGYCLSGFSAEFKAKIKDSLTFSNPKYVQAQKYSKWNSSPRGIPRELRYYEIKGDSICVPYGFDIEKYIIDNVYITDKPLVKNKVSFPPFKLQLRQTQEEAFNAYFEHLDKVNNYGQIVMPTGKGKSLLALAIAAKLNVRTLIVVHKTDLLKVWEEDIKLSLDVPVGIIQGANRKVEDITVAMVQTLNSMKKNEEISEEFLNQFDLIIVDEAHHCPASTYSVIESFKAKYRIGLTATPERNDGLTFILDLFFGSPCYIFENGKEDKDILPVKVFIKNISFEYNPIVEVIKEDLFKQLVSIKLIDEYPKDFKLKLPINTYYLESLRRIKIEFPKNFNRATMERSITNNDYFFNAVMLDLSREIDLNHSCILFFKQKEEVDWWYDKIRMLCKSNFYPVKYYGNNSESENKEILKAIENGLYNITLTTLAKCGEGTNCKAWESVFLISSIGNGKDVEQAVGRARRVKEGKNPIVNLYDYRFPKINCINKGHGEIRDRRYKELKFIDSRIFPKFSLGYPSK